MTPQSLRRKDCQEIDGIGGFHGANHILVGICGSFRIGLVSSTARQQSVHRSTIQVVPWWLQFLAAESFYLLVVDLFFHRQAVNVLLSSDPDSRCKRLCPHLVAVNIVPPRKEESNICAICYLLMLVDHFGRVWLGSFSNGRMGEGEDHYFLMSFSSSSERFFR